MCRYKKRWPQLSLCGIYLHLGIRNANQELHLWVFHQVSHWTSLTYPCHSFSHRACWADADRVSGPHHQGWRRPRWQVDSCFSVSNRFWLGFKGTLWKIHSSCSPFCLNNSLSWLTILFVIVNVSFSTPTSCVLSPQAVPRVIKNFWEREETPTGFASDRGLTWLLPRVTLWDKAKKTETALLEAYWF